MDVLFVGEGNLVAPLTALAQANEFIHVHGTLPQDELAELLGTCHLGLLPMPKRTVWALASRSSAANTSPVGFQCLA